MKKTKKRKGDQDYTLRSKLQENPEEISFRKWTRLSVVEDRRFRGRWGKERLKSIQSGHRERTAYKRWHLREDLEKSETDKDKLRITH